MPAVPLHRAIATKSSIGALFAMAEAEGFVEIWLPTEHACKNGATSATLGALVSANKASR